MLDQDKEFKNTDRYRAPALEKGLDILELLANHGNGLSQGDIAQSLGKTSNEIYRMLSTLVRRDYVVRSLNHDRYMLSLKMFWLSQKYPPVSRLIEMATPLMRKATQKAWQSCHLGMENNGDIIVLTSIKSPSQWSLALRSGATIGLANTGTGRVIAAFRSHEETKQMLEKHKPILGEQKINHDLFFQQLDDIKLQGYDKMPSDTVIGVTNITFPVFDPSGKAIVALCCPYLERIDGFKIPTIEEAIDIFGKLAINLTKLYGGKKPTK